MTRRTSLEPQADAFCAASRFTHSARDRSLAADEGDDSKNRSRLSLRQLGSVRSLARTLSHERFVIPSKKFNGCALDAPRRLGGGKDTILQQGKSTTGLQPRAGFWRHGR